jgi:hypothetical protein
METYFYLDSTTGCPGTSGTFQLAEGSAASWVASTNQCSPFSAIFGLSGTLGNLYACQTGRGVARVTWSP